MGKCGWLGLGRGEGEIREKFEGVGDGRMGKTNRARAKSGGG